MPGLTDSWPLSPSLGASPLSILIQLPGSMREQHLPGPQPTPLRLLIPSVGTDRGRQLSLPLERHLLRLLADKKAKRERCFSPVLEFSCLISPRAPGHALALQRMGRQFKSLPRKCDSSCQRTCWKLPSHESGRAGAQNFLNIWQRGLRYRAQLSHEAAAREYDVERSTSGYPTVPVAGTGGSHRRRDAFVIITKTHRRLILCGALTLLRIFMH